VPYLAVALIYLLIEGICALGLLVLHRQYRAGYRPRMTVLSAKQRTALRTFLDGPRGAGLRQDPALGWVPGSEVNAAGMRDGREYERVPAPGVLRIATFGDSFTYGTEVALGETWEKQLERIAPATQVLNYGVPAYGLDQAYLRYLKVGADYRPHVVLIGYMSENIARNVNVFRPFYTRARRDVLFTKPRFRVVDGELVLVDNPIRTAADYEQFLHHDREVLARLGKDDYHYRIGYDAGALDILPTVRFAKVFRATLHRRVFRPIIGAGGLYGVDSEAYQVTARIFDAFHRAVVERGAVPIIVVFPDPLDQARSRRKRRPRYTPLLDDLRRRGYECIDTLGAFAPHESRYPIKELTRTWGHYSPLGNRLVAEYIAVQLEARGLTDPSRARAAVARARERSGPARP
jgi:hypothetical protein